MTAQPALKDDTVTPLVQPVADAIADVAPELSGMLRVLTCGSVDDGKSTLIGRLLWDATDLFDDQRATLERGRRVDGGNPDFSLLMDGLVAEREQGITIDIAWRYFDTATRRFVVIDSPGHEQYTRNMASGASHADVGAYLLGLWGLANPIVEAVLFHHHPADCGHRGFTPLTAVHVADTRAHETPLDSPIGTPEKPSLAYLKGIGLGDRLGSWRQACQGTGQERTE